jgi:hypothetical protein
MASELTRAYQSELKRTRLATGDAVAQTWRRLGSYNEKDVPRFVAQVEPIVRAGQNRTVALASAYLSRTLKEPPVGVNLDEVVSRVRDGVPMATVYKRPFQTVWNKLGDYEPYDEVITLGQKQASGLSMTDVLLAFTGAMLAYTALSSERIVGFSRVADAGACDYCASLDGTVTGPSEPMPIHNACGCTADPLTQMTHSDREDEVAVGSTVDDAEIDLHGELGPVITNKNQHFTGPNSL